MEITTTTWASLIYRNYLIISIEDHYVKFKRKKKSRCTTSHIRDVQTIEYNHGWIWSTLHIVTISGDYTLKGIRKQQSEQFKTYFNNCVVEYLETKYDASGIILTNIRNLIRALVDKDYYVKNSELVNLLDVIANHRDMLDELSSLANHKMFNYVNDHIVKRQFIAEILHFLSVPQDTINTRNESFILTEKEKYSTLFRSFGDYGLTHEQQYAAVCFEDRNRLIAAAGSGKTYTIVGKIGYALEKKLFSADEIAVLVFNKPVKNEINRKLKNYKVRAYTFHNFGLKILREYNNTKGNRQEKIILESWQIKLLNEIIYHFKKDNPEFMQKWIYYLAVGLFSTEDDGELQSEKDYLDYIKKITHTDKKNKGVQTYVENEFVKSMEELSIANWLYINGVNYVYEKHYKHDVTEFGWQNKVYEPDFYYPDIDYYHEHFALDKDGKAPYYFKDPKQYAISAKAKLVLHAHFGTNLVVTRSADFRSGKVFEKLESFLKSKGVIFKPRSTSFILSQLQKLGRKEPIDIIYKILKQVKINNISTSEIYALAASSRDVIRANAFIAIFIPIYEKYQSRLKEKNKIDFEDMIIRASDILNNSNSTNTPYRFILVDEFQDIAAGRAGLLNAILSKHSGSVLFGVGDDWQSINNFAGSDWSLFKNYQKAFGYSKTAYLTETFRSNIGITNVASMFVRKNADQIPKTVHSKIPGENSVINICTYDTGKNPIGKTIIRQLDNLYAQSEHKISSVFILARYKLKYIDGVNAEDISRWKSHYKERLIIEYSTAHSSKGLEADYVILLGVNNRGYAFPSDRDKDPLVQMFTPNPETFPFAEDRRLFYVALTRAKYHVTILTKVDCYSEFVVELFHKKYRGMVSFNSANEFPRTCQQCKRGAYIIRDNKKNNTQFWACTRFPRCKHTRSIHLKSAP